MTYVMTRVLNRVCPKYDAKRDIMESWRTLDLARHPSAIIVGCTVPVNTWQRLSICGHFGLTFWHVIAPSFLFSMLAASALLPVARLLSYNIVKAWCTWRPRTNGEWTLKWERRSVSCGCIPLLRSGITHAAIFQWHSKVASNAIKCDDLAILKNLDGLLADCWVILMKW